MKIFSMTVKVDLGGNVGDPSKYKMYDFYNASVLKNKLFCEPLKLIKPTFTSTR